MVMEMVTVSNVLQYLPDQCNNMAKNMFIKPNK